MGSSWPATLEQRKDIHSTHLHVTWFATARQPICTIKLWKANCTGHLQQISIKVILTLDDDILMPYQSIWSKFQKIIKNRFIPNFTLIALIHLHGKFHKVHSQLQPRKVLDSDKEENANTNNSCYNQKNSFQLRCSKQYPSLILLHLLVHLIFIIVIVIFVLVIILVIIQVAPKRA